MNTIRGALMFSVGLALVSAASNSVGVCAEPVSEQAEPAKPCHEHPNLEGPCFVLHGRLYMSNGTPEYRIWWIGTKRVLGVSSNFALPGYTRLPEKVATMLTWSQDIIADFSVCPFTKDEPGHMRLVCVDSAKNVQVMRHERS